MYTCIRGRWRNWVIRGIFTWVMIFGFGWIIYMGPLALMGIVSTRYHGVDDQ